MVTFRNNNNVEEITSEEMIEVLNLIQIDLNLALVFQKVRIFKESLLEEIIITPQN